MASRRFWLAGRLGVIAAAVVAAGIWQATEDDSSAPAVRPAPSVALEQLTEAVGGESAKVGSPGFRYLKKLDSGLMDVAASQLGGGTVEAAEAAERQGVTTSAAGDVLVDVYVSGDLTEAEAALRRLGMRVMAVSDREPQRMVEGYLPADALAKAAELSSTRAVLSTFATVNAGAALSQGDGAVHGPAARALGANGSGVAVGIISDSIDQVKGGIADSQASGDLPATVDVLLDGDGRDKDEGRAMAEIVFDEAPGISRIAFSSGIAGAATKAASIDRLVANGVDIIADDMAFFDQPVFQDGIVAQAVDRAKAAGVAYFVSAGNRGRQSWEGTYTPVADPSERSASTADFDPGAGIDTMQTIGTATADRGFIISVHWDEPWGGALTDLAVDAYVLSDADPVKFATADQWNLVTGIPQESLRIALRSEATIGIAIRRVSGGGTPFIKYGVHGMRTAIEHATNTGVIDPDAASAKGAMTVAASHWQTPTKAESFSSRGPVTRTFGANGVRLASPEVRAKPDLAAPDGVATTVPGFGEFYGTSAAAPAAAGIAALMLSADPTLTVDEIYAIMTDAANVSDCPASPDPDPDCGVGFALADKAVAMTLARAS